MRKWTARLALIFALWWMVPFTPDVADAQAANNRNVTVQASGAQTVPATGTTADVSACLLPGTNTGYVMVQVITTAGSGTVGTYKVWLEGSGDGTNWAAIPCWSTLSATATTPTASTHLIMNETAVVTSGTAVGFCSLPVSTVRTRWNIAGTTPSETFSVILSCYS